jgi:hypothetical protein
MLIARLMIAVLVSADEAPGTELKVTPLGYVEASYSYSFARPSNGIVNLRGFNNRHDTMTIENAAAGATWEYGSVGGKLLLQVGNTPSTYYLAEPVFAGAGGANASTPELWKYIQEAFVTWKAPVGNGLLFQAGLCVSPIGAEVIPAKDDWNWSRSNLFFGLPFYHTGARATYALTDRFSVTLSIFNGWSSVVDNNRHKSVSAAFSYTIPDLLFAQVLYFGGVERAKGAPEGSGWRHDFDGYASVRVTEGLSLLGHLNGGFESTAFGTASWVAGAAYARAQLTEQLFLALRGDRFHETVPGAASPIFWAGAKWISSGTVTIDVRPADHLSVRAEYRHDRAERDLFFRRAVDGDGATAPFVPNTRSQDTVTIGVTGWF